ncbi:hypothetical protein CRG98_001548 [Punica granatum]|uniref:Uncharacterized protein n=1 Tax=Punica granatum TaxID=22663 RepID=A0A2I0LBP1_PUNGR|nr:hypothetical protein CRG98_001548 [Punica granatum]
MARQSKKSLFILKSAKLSRRHVHATEGLQGSPKDRVDPRLFSKNDHHSHLCGSVRNQEPLTLPQNSIGRHRGNVRPDWCQTGPKFQTCSVFRDLCRAVRVDPIILGPNDHHSHLRGSVRSQELLTLPQNSIRSLRGDVRPDLCQSVGKNIPARERQRAHGLPSMRGGRMLSRSFRARNGLLGPIQV